MHHPRDPGYRSGMGAYVILLLVLVGIILVAAAIMDLRRAREIEREAARRRRDHD
jgi:hypothetical protein